MASTSHPPVEPRREPLWPGGIVPAESSFVPFIELFPPLAPEFALPATIVILPGGGYGGHSPYERLWAEMIRAMGFGAAVVHYRLASSRWPTPFRDALRAIRLIKSRGAGWGLPSAHIALMGGSAGGHLAALAATRPEWNPPPQEDDLAGAVSATVERLILLYPVISSARQARSASIDRLLPGHPTSQSIRALSAERHVTAKTPPALLIHGAHDEGVSVENSLLFARACWRAGVPAELHVFPVPGHGRAFQYHPEIAWLWRDLLHRWLGEWARQF